MLNNKTYNMFYLYIVNLQIYYSDHCTMWLPLPELLF